MGVAIHGGAPLQPQAARLCKSIGAVVVLIAVGALAGCLRGARRVSTPSSHCGTNSAYSGFLDWQRLATTAPIIDWKQDLRLDAAYPRMPAARLIDAVLSTEQADWADSLALRDS